MSGPKPHAALQHDAHIDVGLTGIKRIFVRRTKSYLSSALDRAAALIEGVAISVSNFSLFDLFWLDSDGAVARFNPAYGELLGDRSCDLVGRRPDEWIHEDDRGAYENALIEARAGQMPQPLELRFLSGDRRPVWGRLSLVAL